MTVESWGTYKRAFGQSFTIAASDTPAPLRMRATYRCDGTADTGGDQVEINAALQEVDTVILSPGTYWIDGPIIMSSNKTLIGAGTATILKLKNGINTHIHMIINSDTVNGNSWITIKNLKLDGNYKMLAGGEPTGIDFEKVTYSRIEGCYIENFNYNGVCLISSDNNIISNNVFRENHNYEAIILFESNSNIVSNNTFKENYCSSIIIKSFSNANTIIGNSIYVWNKLGTHGYAIFLSNACSNIVSNNLCDGGGMGMGIFLEKDSHNNIISGNICNRFWNEGIYVNQSNNNIIVGNICMQNSQFMNNFWSNIVIRGGSSNNLISGNICRKGELTNKPKYGINIYSGCNNNVVEGNNLYDSGVSGDLYDAGTNTKKRDNIGNDGNWLTDV